MVDKRIIFVVGEEDLEEGVELAIVTELQLSYSARGNVLKAAFKYLGDNSWVPIFEVTLDGFYKDNLRRPLSRWAGVEAYFKDLIVAMANIHPAKRITTRQALAHRWFDVV